MMRLLLLLLLLFASVYLGTWLYHSPGYIYLSIHHWRVETSFAVGMVLLLMMFCLFHFMLNGLSAVWRVPLRFHVWASKRRMQKAKKTTHQGLIEFSEGYWQKAEHDLIKALPNAETPLFNYLIAARAAQELGDYRMRDEYLRQAQHAVPDAKFAIELTQAQLQMANKQWEQALATLCHLKDLAPRHPYVLKLLSQLFAEVNDWQELLRLLPELKKNRILNAHEYDTLEQRTTIEAIHDLIRTGQTNALERFITHLPKTLRTNADIVHAYANALVSQHRLSDAEYYLRQHLKERVDEAWITLYGRLNVNEHQLPFAESLLKKNPSNPELLLCLGQMSLHQHLFGKAKQYFELSIKAKPSAKAYQALANILDMLNDSQGALEAYRNGLALCIQAGEPYPVSQDVNKKE